jgi:hypothetical protein
MHSARLICDMSGPPAALLVCSRLPVVLAVFFGTACSSGAALLSAPAEVAPTGAPLAPHAPTLLWVRFADGNSPVTYALSDQGEIVTKLPGIHIAAAGTEWTWEEALEPVQTCACSGATDQPAGEGRGTRVRLVPSDSAHDPLALVVPPDGDGDNEIEHTARLLASIGPYLFVEESTYAYTCGAHGSIEVRFAVWSVEEASTLDLLAELPNRERLVAAGKSALDQGAPSPSEVDFSSDDDPPTLTELLPRVGAHGRLEASALISVPTCYACTGGGWSSYTNSTPVPAELPARLRRLGPPPRAVQLFADAHPDLDIAGYSVASTDGPLDGPLKDSSGTAPHR